MWMHLWTLKEKEIEKKYLICLKANSRPGENNQDKLKAAEFGVNGRNDW